MPERYRPIDARISPRFAGIRTFMRLPHNTDVANADFAFLGIPFDTGTTFRPGARFGPVAIREMSTLLKPYNQVLDIDVFEWCSGIDLGDVDMVSGYIEDTFTAIENTLRPVAEAGAVPICLGGDHSITLAELRAVAGVHGPVALIHMDAHSDTGDLYFGKKYNHGTPFRRAIEEGLLVPEASTQFGIRGTLYSRDDLAAAERLGLRCIPAHMVRQLGFAAVVEEVRDRAGDRPYSFHLTWISSIRPMPRELAHPKWQASPAQKSWTSSDNLSACAWWDVTLLRCCRRKTTDRSQRHSRPQWRSNLRVWSHVARQCSRNGHDNGIV